MPPGCHRRPADRNESLSTEVDRALETLTQREREARHHQAPAAADPAPCPVRSTESRHRNLGDDSRGDRRSSTQTRERVRHHQEGDPPPRNRRGRNSAAREATHEIQPLTFGAHLAAFMGLREGEPPVSPAKASRSKLLKSISGIKFIGCLLWLVVVGAYTTGFLVCDIFAIFVDRLWLAVAQETFQVG